MKNEKWVKGTPAYSIYHMGKFSLPAIPATLAWICMMDNPPVGLLHWACKPLCCPASVCLICVSTGVLSWRKSPESAMETSVDLSQVVELTHQKQGPGRQPQLCEEGWARLTTVFTERGGYQLQRELTSGGLTCYQETSREPPFTIPLRSYLGGEFWFKD